MRDGPMSRASLICSSEIIVLITLPSCASEAGPVLFGSLALEPTVQVWLGSLLVMLLGSLTLVELVDWQPPLPFSRMMPKAVSVAPPP